MQLFYSAEGKRIKFTDVTVEGEDTKIRFAQDYETVHSTGATMTIVILFVQIYYFFAINVSHTKIYMLFKLWCNGM